MVERGSSEKGKSPASAGASEVSQRLPDAAEIQRITETKQLYKSNLFRLQLEQLLEELTPKHGHVEVQDLEAFLKSSLRPVLDALQPREIPADFAREFPNLRFQSPAKALQPMAFSKPTRVDVVGSFLLKTVCRPNLCVDVAVELPMSAFQSKDYLNFRYLDKRCAYIGELHRQLKKHYDSSTGTAGSRAVVVGYEAFQGDLHKPCVLLTCSASQMAGGGAVKKEKRTDGLWGRCWTVRLIPAAPEGLFLPSRLGPERNAWRRLGGQDTPTPSYNMAVLEDTRFRTHLKYIHHAIEQFPALRDAIVLLKRWAAARCGSLTMTHSKGVVDDVRAFTALGSFPLSMLAAHAVKTAEVAPACSSYQIFRLALDAPMRIDFT